MPTTHRQLTKGQFLKGFHFKFPHVITDLKELSRKITFHKAKKPAASRILAGSKSVQVETRTKSLNTCTYNRYLRPGSPHRAVVEMKPNNSILIA